MGINPQCLDVITIALLTELLNYEARRERVKGDYSGNYSIVNVKSTKYQACNDTEHKKQLMYSQRPKLSRSEAS